MKPMSLIKFVGIALISTTIVVGNAWAQTIPETAGFTCLNCGIDGSNSNGWLTSGNNDMGSTTSTGNFAWDTTVPVPPTGQTDGFMYLHSWSNTTGTLASWQGPITGLTAGQSYTVTVYAIGASTTPGASDITGCLSAARVAIDPDETLPATYDASVDMFNLGANAVLQQANVDCAENAGAQWTQIGVTFTAQKSDAVIYISGDGTSANNSSSAAAIVGTNAISGGGSSSACNTSTDADCDGILDSAENPGEENNPCLPNTSAYAIANCADLAVSKAYVGENTSNCASGSEWSLAVSNAAGPGSASGVAVTDTLSSGAITSMAVTASSTGTASCSVTGTGTSTATCTLNEDVAQGNTVTITVCS